MVNFSSLCLKITKHVLNSLAEFHCGSILHLILVSCQTFNIFLHTQIKSDVYIYCIKQNIQPSFSLFGIQYLFLFSSQLGLLYLFVW